MSNELPSSDKELAERFIAYGDENALRQLIDKYSGRAYQTAYGILNNREDAEEIAQDTFIRICRALPSFRWECEFSTWVYTIAMNLARNRHRWNKVRGKNVNISLNAPVTINDKGNDCFLDIADDKIQDPTTQLCYAELQLRVQRAMQQLPESFRMAVILRNVQHLSYEEIADILKCNIGTVKSRINRGREMLKEALKRDE